MIPKINSTVYNKRDYSFKNKPKLTFKAKPKEILNALSRNVVSTKSRKFLQGLAEYYLGVVNSFEKPLEKSINIPLGQKNNLPPEVANLHFDGLSVAQMDKKLNTEYFLCSFRSQSSCKAAVPKGLVAKKLLIKLKVKNPHIIELGK